MDFLPLFSIFVLACFVGYYVVWSVTPALHTPLMAVTNAISSVIIVGALIAAAATKVPKCDVVTVQVDCDRSPEGCYSSALPPAGSAVGCNPVASSDETVAVNRQLTSSGRILDEHLIMPPTDLAPAPGRRWAKWLGLLATVLASVNIFGGFAVTERMLAMYKKKDR